MKEFEKMESLISALRVEAENIERMKKERQEVRGMLRILVGFYDKGVIGRSDYLDKFMKEIREYLDERTN